MTWEDEGRMTLEDEGRMTWEEKLGILFGKGGEGPW